MADNRRQAWLAGEAREHKPAGGPESAVAEGLAIKCDGLLTAGTRLHEASAYRHRSYQVKPVRKRCANAQ